MNAPYVLLLVLPAATLAINLKPYNETAHMMFVESDFNNDGAFSRNELDMVFKVSKTIMEMPELEIFYTDSLTVEEQCRRKTT